MMVAIITQTVSMARDDGRHLVAAFGLIGRLALAFGGGTNHGVDPVRDGPVTQIARSVRERPVSIETIALMPARRSPMSWSGSKRSAAARAAPP